MKEDLNDAIVTMHHEFLHAILGSKEGHGATFQKHEPRIKPEIVEIVNSLDKIAKRRFS
jgi:hypothetical protein